MVENNNPINCMSKLRIKDTTNINFLHLYRKRWYTKKFDLSIDKNKIISYLLFILEVNQNL